jgi:hypothetical protein
VSLVRRNYGSGHSYLVDGLYAPGVTSINDAALAKGGLVPWAAKACANEVLNRWDELAELTPSERFEIVRSAPERDRDEAARRGTEVHDLAQKLLVGQEVEVPDELKGHVDSYLAFDREWGVHEVLVETPVASRSPLYAGTLDMIADLADKRRWLVDLKTTRSGVFAENAFQLAAYRYAQFYVDTAGSEQPLPQVEATGVVWIRADGYDLVPVEAGPREFRLFQMAIEIARVIDNRMRDKLGGPDVIGPALTPPLKEKVA